jgi:DNA-binding HxlR family transcriptional regulator
MKVHDERFLRGLYDLKYLFGDKWAPAILVTLSDGPMRRKETLSTISPSVSRGEVRHAPEMKRSACPVRETVTC